MDKRTKRHVYERLGGLLNTYKTYLRHSEEFNFYTASALNMAYRTAGWSVIGAYFVEDVITEYEYNKIMSIWSKVVDKYAPEI